ncbi:hypothetical protein AB688_18855 [Pseudomonas putida]|nr:hypothetical protein AB688_18855 [Pseudomonas putida]
MARALPVIAGKPAPTEALQALWNEYGRVQGQRLRSALELHLGQHSLQQRAHGIECSMTVA